VILIPVVDGHAGTPLCLGRGSCSSEGRYRYAGPRIVSYRDQWNTMPAPTNKLFWWSFVEFAKVVK
jgi:hypothetical protein